MIDCKCPIFAENHLRFVSMTTCIIQNFLIFVCNFRNTERVNVEAHLFAINTKIQANQQRPYAVPLGKQVSDISTAWEAMEAAEHDREMALRQELLRQVSSWENFSWKSNGLSTASWQW